MYDNCLHFVKEIEKSPNSIYQMGNEELADCCYMHIKEKYPEAVLIKREGIQYFALNDKAKRKLKKKLEEIRDALKAELSVLEDSITSLV